MNRKLILAAVLTTWLAGDAVHAQGLISALPVDGTYAEFDFSQIIEETRKQQTVGGVLTVKSVGTVEHERQRCRWIEVKLLFDRRAKDRERRWVAKKVLVPEQHFGTGKAPLEHVVRGYSIVDSVADRPSEIGPQVDAPQLHARLWPLQAILIGTVKNAKMLPPETVKSALGERRCRGVSGKNQFQRGKVKAVGSYQSRMHSDAPFGVVSSRAVFEMSVEDIMFTQTYTMLLRGTGTDAQSEFPDLL